MAIARFAPPHAPGFIADLETNAAACTEWDERLADGTSFHLRSTKLEGPDRGERTLRYLVNSSVPPDRTFELYLVYVQRGEVVVAMNYRAEGAIDAQEALDYENVVIAHFDAVTP